MRCFLVVLSGLLVLGAHGQAQFHAQLSSALSAPAEKVLRAALRGFDQESTLAVNGPELDLVLRWDLTAPQLDAVLAPFGHSVIALDRVLVPDAPGTAKAAAPTAWPVDFPVRLDTGDPVADDARYELHKSTWIAAYPELYRHMAEPLPATPPPDPE